MKKKFSTAFLVFGMSLVLGLAASTGCGPGGAPAPPEDVAEPTDYDSPEYAEGERESIDG